MCETWCANESDGSEYIPLEGEGVDLAPVTTRARGEVVDGIDTADAGIALNLITAGNGTHSSGFRGEEDASGLDTAGVASARTTRDKTAGVVGSDEDSLVSRRLVLSSEKLMNAHGSQRRLGAESLEGEVRGASGLGENNGRSSRGQDRDGGIGVRGLHVSRLVDDD